MLLNDKVAVIYGAGGAIGGAVARAFAPEGATLFLTGRQLAPVEAVAKDVVAAGGSAQAAEVDALDEQAVDRHLQSVTERAGRVEISFNAVGIPDPTSGLVPLVELDVEQFSLPRCCRARWSVKKSRSPRAATSAARSASDPGRISSFAVTRLSLTSVELWLQSGPQLACIGTTGSYPCASSATAWLSPRPLLVVPGAGNNET
jgi:NAD(P)-dependent dehydrogenase (short-subunit alcohol dehydrogenase family)